MISKIFLLSVLFFGLTFSLPKNKFIAKFRNVECNFNPIWITNGTCKVRAINRYKRGLDIYFVPLKPLYDVTVEAKTYKRYSGWKPWVMNSKFSFCEALSGRFNIFFKMIKKIYKYCTNVNHTCPYSHPVIMQNCDLEYLDIGASIMPDGIYRFVVNGYERNFSLGHFFVDLEVSERN